MSTTLNELSAPPGQPVARGTARQRERLFFSGMAVALTVAVFAGFAPTYYLHGVYDSPNPLTPALHWHGLAFSLWMALLMTQTALIAGRRADLHRRLGVAGVGLGLVMVALGVFIAITRTRDGLSASIEGVPPLAFLAVPLIGMIVFPALLGAAVYYRRRSDVHKRLMLIATLELVTAGIARLPFIAPYGPVAFFGATDLFLAAIVVYDLATLKRVHLATLWGGLLLIASQPLRLLIGGTAPWLAFAAWLTG